jgi:hypothetical protein
VLSCGDQQLHGPQELFCADVGHRGQCCLQGTAQALTRVSGQASRQAGGAADRAAVMNVGVLGGVIVALLVAAAASVLIVAVFV